MQDGNWQSKLEVTVGKLVDQVQSVLCLDIYTYAIDINKPDDAPDKRRAMAEMHMTPTGDIRQVLPAQFLGDNITINKDVYALHTEAVDKAIQTRKEMLNYAKGFIVELKELLP